MFLLPSYDRRLAGFAAAELVSAIVTSVTLILLAVLAITSEGRGDVGHMPRPLPRIASLEACVGHLRHVIADHLGREDSAPRRVSVMRCDAEWWGDVLPVEEAERLSTTPLTVYVRRARWLDPAAATVLGRSSAMLVFDCVESLSARAAAGLAGHAGHIRLDALTTLDSDVARSLAACRGWLAINGLREIDHASARALSAHSGMLSLNGIVVIDETVAESLALMEGDLCLNGILSLTPPAAEALARHRHRLHLCGLREIDEEVATALADYRGTMLALDGLTTLQALTPETARRLRSARGISLQRAAQ